MNEINYEEWFGETESSKIFILTDSKQEIMIREIMIDVVCKSIKIINLDVEKFDINEIVKLKKNDLTIVALSLDSFVYKGFNSIFSPFRKPKNISCKYVFIRLDITKSSLTEGLMTEKSLIMNEIKKFLEIQKGSRIRVTAPSGTDISFDINMFSTCNHFIDKKSDIAFLPPSELEAGICLGTANGIIVVDITIGQINQYGKYLGQFGLVDKPVKLIVKESCIVDVIGNEELKKILESLEEEARVLVELGKGLSKMSPTGVIGIDESIITTCHFGIGDGSCVNIENKASIHLDVVVDRPVIQVNKF